jgi:hypothetical protein
MSCKNHKEINSCRNSNPNRDSTRTSLMVNTFVFEGVHGVDHAIIGKG